MAAEEVEGAVFGSYVEQPGEGVSSPEVIEDAGFFGGWDVAVDGCGGYVGGVKGFDLVCLGSG